MKKIFTLLFVFAFVNLFAQNYSAKLSPFTKKLLLEKGRKETADYIYKYVHITEGNKIFLSAMIKTNGFLNENDLNALDVKIGTRAGNILTVKIPLDKIEAFTLVGGVEYIQLDEPSIPLLDNARLYTRADSVHAGINLPMPYSGKDVVVGVVDAGYDFQHPCYFDTNGVNYRVKKVWMQKNTAGPAPAGYSYGTEMTDSLALWTQGTDNGQTHATHVSGICAGSGFGGLTTNNRFRGFAYDADMVLVGITPDKSQWISTGVSNMIDGINYIFSYANSESKPAVVNLSWGSPLGPRDGSGLFSQALSNLVTAGNIFVCSAGNNGTDSLHIQKSFSPSDTIVRTYLRIEPSPAGGMTWVDMWGDSGKTFCAEVSLINNGAIASTGYVCLDDSTHEFYLIGFNSDTCYVAMMTSSSEFNNKPRIFFDFDSRLTADSIMISVTGTDGTINFWNTFVYNTSGYYGAFKSFGNPNAVDGDREITISDIASSDDAISVGAYASKVNWTDITGSSWTYASYVAQGNIVPFSSHGPTVDGRVKPDITGPGLTVGSALSSLDSSFFSTGPDYFLVVNTYLNPQNSRYYPYGMLSGTSMSGPAVAGIVALMLQVKPDLTPQQVKDIIRQTAITDSWTGSLPVGGTNTWGHGKVNAYAAVKEAIQLATAVNTISQPTLNCSLYPNPNTGSFILNYSGEKSEALQIGVYDLSGRLVYNQQWDVNAGYNYLTIDTKFLSTGSYFTRVNSNIGMSVIKMVVGR